MTKVTLGADIRTPPTESWQVEYWLGVGEIAYQLGRFLLAHPSKSVHWQDGQLRMGDVTIGTRGLDLMSEDWQRFLEMVGLDGS